MASQQPATDAVKLGDGTVMQIARLPEVDDGTWSDMKSYLENNPEIAKGLQNFTKNPQAMRGWLQTQAIAEHYQSQLESGDNSLSQKVHELETDNEIKHVFDEIKTNGLQAAMKYWDDEELMKKISQKMGGVPNQLAPTLQKIDDTPLSIHEAAKQGDLKAVLEYLKKKQPVDAHDIRGITPLGYAIGANKVAVVRSLLEANANPSVVDTGGNTGLHYAAGYGRRELAEYLIHIKANVNKANAQGQTPITVASLNKHQVTIDLLAQNGAR